MLKSRARFQCVWMLVAALSPVPQARAQGATRPAVTPPQAAPLNDTLGRDTPRGTVLGFLNAARESRNDVAPLYLNTSLRDREAADLAHKLFVVLDSRLPPRLNDLSDRPEGSLANPLKPDQDIVGSITTANGPLELVVERVNRGPLGYVWLFSRKTLEAIPDVYDEVDLVAVDRFLPAFLTRPRIAGIRLFQWLVLALIFPISYRLTRLLGRLVRPAVVAWRRHQGRTGELPANLMPGAIWLLLLSIVIRWLVVSIELPLLERVFWSAITTMLGIVAVAWSLLALNGVIERCIQRRLQGARHGEMVAMLRLVRRVADVFVVATGGLVTLHYVGVDPTAALAGLGIGGIAVALAAQKTLENVVGGVSIIIDQAVRVGDFLKLGDTVGTVDSIGLRSTRIRTLDRTVLSVPNGQIANVNIETLSARDKFWFHHFVGLRYETTAGQMRAAVNGIRIYLAAHPMVDRGEPIRVRFLRLGPFSLDIELFAYIDAGDWEAFLETQQELLLEVMDIIDRSGAAMALPSQILHLADGRDDAPGAGWIGVARPAPVEAHHQRAESA